MQNEGGQVTIRCMEAGDIPDGLRLCRIAGWNQIEQDWRRFISMEPAGCFVACCDGKVCGTAATVSYGDRCGWIGMVLVDPEVRGRGIGTELLKKTIAYLENAGVETQKLDATPMGHGLYLQLGFVDEYQIERWEGKGRGAGGPALGLMTRDQLQLVCCWDREIFGADRTRLLTRIWEEGPAYSAVATRGTDILGYMLGRAGARAHYLGPWVALPGTGIAARLFTEFLARVPDESVFVDISLPNPEAKEIVSSAGFVQQRILTRMYRGPNRHPGIPAHVAALAGPELG